MATPSPAAPTPVAVDELASRHETLEAELEEIEKQAAEEAAPKQAELERLEVQLLNLVKAHGSAHAEKSKLLHGIAWEVMATFGSSTSTDNAALERFRLALVKAKQGRLLRRMFEKTVRWLLKPEAAEVVKGSKLSPGLLALYSQIAVIKPNTPKLIVRPKKTTA